MDQIFDHRLDALGTEVAHFLALLMSPLAKHEWEGEGGARLRSKSRDKDKSLSKTSTMNPFRLKQPFRATKQFRGGIWYVGRLNNMMWCPMCAWRQRQVSQRSGMCPDLWWLAMIVDWSVGWHSRRFAKSFKRDMFNRIVQCLAYT